MLLCLLLWVWHQLSVVSPSPFASWPCPQEEDPPPRSCVGCSCHRRRCAEWPAWRSWRPCWSRSPARWTGRRQTDWSWPGRCGSGSPQPQGCTWTPRALSGWGICSPPRHRKSGVIKSRENQWSERTEQSRHYNYTQGKEGTQRKKKKRKKGGGGGWREKQTNGSFRKQRKADRGNTGNIRNREKQVLQKNSNQMNSQTRHKVGKEPTFCLKKSHCSMDVGDTIMILV